MQGPDPTLKGLQTGSNPADPAGVVCPYRFLNEMVDLKHTQKRRPSRPEPFVPSIIGKELTAVIVPGTAPPTGVNVLLSCTTLGACRKPSPQFAVLFPLSDTVSSSRKPAPVPWVFNWLFSLFTLSLVLQFGPVQVSTALATVIESDTDADVPALEVMFTTTV